MPANKVVIVYIANSLLYQENTQRITHYNSLLYQQHAQRITHHNSLLYQQHVQQITHYNSLLYQQHAQRITHHNSLLYQQHTQQITHLARRPDRVAVGYSVEGGGLLEARARSTCCSRLGISSVVSVLLAIGF